MPESSGHPAAVYLVIYFDSVAELLLQYIQPRTLKGTGIQCAHGFSVLQFYFSCDLVVDMWVGGMMTSQFHIKLTMFYCNPMVGMELVCMMQFDVPI